MTLHALPVVANGLGTDHPIPGLPFVDDSHLPLDDPDAIEAIGRNREEGMWGRTDPCPPGWVAFTTDEIRKDLAWVVRWDPEHGRSVMLYRDGDASSAYSAFSIYVKRSQLTRSGGYWWDGQTWFRPAQIWDWATEDYVPREVPGATTVTAAQILARGGNADRGRVLQIIDVDPDSRYEGSWNDDLALWASRRPAKARPLEGSVVRLSAPELAGEDLIGLTELAELADIAASTLRSYLARGENDVPAPQAQVSGRPVWSREVAAEWLEQRRRTPDGLEAALSIPDARTGTQHPIGVQELWARYTHAFAGTLWDFPNLRKRFALRFRTRPGIEEVAHHLAWVVAGDIRHIVPVPEFGITIRAAVIHEFQTGLELAKSIGGEEFDRDTYLQQPGCFFGILHPIAKSLGWMIRHVPDVAGSVVGEILFEASHKLDIPTPVTERSIRTALDLDSGLSHEVIDEFLSRVFTPTK